MTASALRALYAQVAPVAAPVTSLAGKDRRRPGAELPTVPAAGQELASDQVAAALFEAFADEFTVPVPSTDTLHVALTAAVRKLSRTGLEHCTRVFWELDPVEFQEVGLCRALAYRLALSFWYAGARSRPMTAGEAAVALYLSDAYRRCQVDALTIQRAPLLVSRAIRQGAALVPTETLVRLGEAMAREFAAPAGVTGVTGTVTPEGTQVTPEAGTASRQGVTPVTPGCDWLYRQALPDYHRRRFCFDLMRADTRQPSPLLVRLDAGGYLLGATPPPGPDGTWRRALRAEW